MVRGRVLGDRRFAHDTLVTALAFSPDGERLATGSMDGVVRVFDLEGRELERRSAHQAEVRFVGFLEGGTLVSAGLDRRVLIGDVALESSRVPSVAVCGGRVAWTPDANTIAVLESGREVGRVPLPGVVCVALSPSGERVAAVSSSVASVWDVGRALRVTHRLRGSLTPDGVAFLDDARLGVRYHTAVVALRVGRLRDLEEDGEQPIVLRGAEGLALADDGTVACAWMGGGEGANGVVTLERPSQPRVEVSVPLAQSRIALSRDGRLAAAASYCGVVLLDATTGVEVARPVASRAAIVDVAFADSKVETISQDARLVVWDVDRERGGGARRVEQGTYPRGFARSPSGSFTRVDGALTSRHRVEATALSPARGRVAVGYSNGELLVVDRETKGELRRWFFGSVRFQRLTFSRDGAEIIALASGQLHIVDVARGADRSPLHASCRGFGSTARGLLWLDALGVLQPDGVPLEGPAEFAVFSPRGDLVALGGGPRITLCDTRTGRRVATLEGHRRGVTALAFSEDGALLASGDASGAVWVWELQ